MLPVPGTDGTQTLSSITQQTIKSIVKLKVSLKVRLKAGSWSWSGLGQVMIRSGLTQTPIPTPECQMTQDESRMTKDDPRMTLG